MGMQMDAGKVFTSFSDSCPLFLRLEQNSERDLSSFLTQNSKESESLDEEKLVCHPASEEAVILQTLEAPSARCVASLLREGAEAPGSML